MRYGWAWWGSPVGGRWEGAGAGGEGQTYHPGALSLLLVLKVILVNFDDNRSPDWHLHRCWNCRAPWRSWAVVWTGWKRKTWGWGVKTKFWDSISKIWWRHQRWATSSQNLKKWMSSCTGVVFLGRLRRHPILTNNILWCFLSVQVFQGTDERPSKWHWLFKISQNYLSLCEQPR